MMTHIFGILLRPAQEWQRIAATADRTSNLLPLCVLALLPALSWHYGTTQVGWTVGGGEVVKLTTASANPIIALFYLAMVVSVVLIGFFIHWMAANYGAQSSVMRGISIAVYTATPLFIAGLVGFHPMLGVDMLIGVLAISWSIYLLYIGIPAVMHMPAERGFLFASAVVAVCLVVLIAIMGASVVLWEFGAGPEFTN